MSTQVTPLSLSRRQRHSRPRLVLGAMGIVFGDIGTSPLYALRESVRAAGGVSATSMLGIVSLILWSIVIVVTLKYVAFVMRADNDGQGGILALAALASRTANARAARTLFALGMFGAAMFYGDSMITPAVSVTSALEGLALIDPGLKTWILPFALVVITVLFRLQRRGTASVGKLFGPVMAIWFGVLALLGLVHIADYPAILWAISPLHAAAFIARAPLTSFIVLGSVFLALTGAEALYADMGHFGRWPVRAAWLFAVLPCLVLHYLGQAAFVLTHASAAAQPFFAMAPRWALVPLVVLAMVATVIASQAVISGAFSLTSQAVQFGFLPRIPAVHTSTREMGQVYVPFVNGVLYLVIVLLVLTFRSSANLSSAYGIAVSSTMLLTTVLMYFVARYAWRWSIPATRAVVLPLFLIDTFFS